MNKKTSVSPRRWLLIPIETKARELMAKILLACHAAQDGWGVVVGSKEIIRRQQPRLPKGVILEKDADLTHEDLIGVAQTNGNTLSVMDEEGLVEYGSEDYLKKRVSKTYFEALDYFFTWGDVQAKWLESLGGDAHRKVIRSGNPRFDLLRPEYRSIFYSASRGINEKFGRIILFNTNFGKVNTNMGKDFVSYLKEAGKLSDSDSERFYTDATAFEGKHLKSFLSVIPLVADRYPTHTIVVRPHPSESHEPWLELAKRYRNLQVLYEGSVHEWILASEVVIHVNCTTGVEAYLLDKPVIAFRANKDPRFDFPVTYELSMQVTTDEELFSLVDRIIGKEAVPRQALSPNGAIVAAQYISAMQGKLASETIIDALGELSLPRSGARFPIRIQRPSISSRLIYRSRHAIEKYFGLGSGGSKEINPSYARKKFPGIKFTEVREAIEQIKKNSPTFSAVKVTPVGKDTFCLYKD